MNRQARNRQARNRQHVQRWVIVTLCLAMVAGACSGGEDEPEAGARSENGAGPFSLRLSTGEQTGAASSSLAVAAGESLADDRVAQITDRLPTLEADDDDKADFTRPAESLPPPRVGETIELPFGVPAQQAPPEVPSGPLEVLRHQPDGDVAVAPFISVTFSQPMVPVGTLDQLDLTDVPIEVTPEVDGRWRWIGTRTLRLEHTTTEIDRLPAATDYTVTIPSGTESETGGALAEEFSFTFSTPPPQVISFTPSFEVIDTAPVFVATFDQRVDPDAVLDTIDLTAGGDTRGVRLATDDEVEADDEARAQVEQALDARVVAFTPDAALPTGTAIEIAVGPETPSAEGPLTSAEPFAESTRTYDDLRVINTICGFDGCRPGSFMAIEFNNPIDPEAFDSDSVSIEPDVDAAFAPQGNQLVIQGSTLANTEYEVTLPADLLDSFGQTLGDDERVTFDVGEASPVLTRFPRQVITTDPFADRPRVPIVSIGHESLQVTVHDVDAADFGEYVSFVERWDGENLDGLPGWTEISSETVTIDEPAQLTETNIDVPDGFVVVTVEPTRSFDRDTEDYWNNRPTFAWVQTTGIGLDALADQSDLVTWATDLKTGAPIDGVTVRPAASGPGVITDADGLATLGLDGARFLLAEREDDQTILFPEFGGRWESFPDRDQARWHTFDGRGLFRPGDELRVKGWVRRLTLATDARITAVPDGATVRYTVRDNFGNDLATGDLELTEHGGFDLTANLPAGAALGPASVELFLIGGTDFGSVTSQHPFQIEEFRRPEFEVLTAAESSEPQVSTAAVTVSAEATSFAGGTLPDAPITWQVTTRNTTYTPPNRPDFTFGVAPPPWLYEDFGFGGGIDEEFGAPCCFGDVPFEDDAENFTYSARTDAAGRHLLQIDFSGQRPDEPIIVSANAAVEDVNRQSFGSTIDLLVHPAELYVGLRSERNFVRQGEPLAVDAIVTDIDGALVADREIIVTAARVTEKFEGGEIVEVDVDPQECVVISGDDPVACEFDTVTGGQYRITAKVFDDEEGTNTTELTRFVSGAEAVATRSVDQQVVTLVPDATDHAPGDTAEVLVISPFVDGHGLLTVTRDRIVETRNFELDDGSAVLDIDLTDASVPGVDVHVDIAGSAPRIGADGRAGDDLPPRPAFASGDLPISVQATTRTLEVTATPASASLEPGASTSVAVSVVGPDGSPATSAEVALVVVDEAVLSLVGYELADPIDSFYQRLSGQLRVDRSRDGILLDDPATFGEDGEIDPDSPSTTTAGPAEGDEASTFDQSAGDLAATDTAAPAAERSAQGAGSNGQPIQIREDFSELVTFEPTVVTGADGTATVDFDLPDSLTRYRVMAVAVDGDDQFGSGESTITARLPLQVRPSPPRFVNFGDVFEFPVVIQNQSDEAITADVVLEATNLSVTGPAGKQVEVPANDRVEVRFDVAAEDAGTARFRATTVSGELSDSATGAFPAYTPTTTEAFATHGVIDDGAVAQPLLSPEGVIEQFGGLEIDTSSTALQSLTDAVGYLTDYPYDSADAYASRITALVSLRDVFEAFATPGKPTPAELDATIRSDVERLEALQNGDGGFPTWQVGRPSEPYLTVQATHALVVAEAAGYPVSADVETLALEYLRTIEDRFPLDWPDEAERPVEAYALNVRDLAGDRDAAKAAALYREGDLALDALAWIWPVVDDPTIDAEIALEFANRVTENPGAASFTSGYDESAAALVLASDRRTDGIILDALIIKAPDSDLIPKVVSGLIGNQRKGRWNNVQENGFILLAMKRYFDTFEDVEPAFVAQAWLGDAYTAEHGHLGRSIDTTHTLVPMSELGGDPDIVIAKNGAGRLYWRLGLRYAPDRLDLDPREEGFVVTRTYEAVNDEADVVLNDDGSWTIAPGAMVRVRISMVADSQRTNMALVDPLPAGLEALNPGLAASPRPPAEEIDEGEVDLLPAPWFGYSWFDHQNFRDDRTEAYSSYLPAGVYEYTYVARATTPGTFVTPPAKAEEIYSPEVFGRSGTDTVTVG